jgi:hypothetical protein
MEAVRVLLGLLTLAVLGVAQAPTAINFDDLHRSNPTPSFDHGYVAAWDIKQLHSITLYAPDGHEMFSVLALKLPDGSSTNTPISVAVDTDGISSFAYIADKGRRSGIAILDAVGNQTRVMETEPYKPSQVCFAPDHSIWMFGDQWKTSGTLEPDFMVFRHYSRDGKLIGSFVPRSALPRWEGAGLDQAVAPFIGHWRLRATKDRIGAALYLGGFKEEWVELNFNGELLGQWSYIRSRDDSVLPAAFDEKGILYGEHWTGHVRDGIAVFDRATSSWKRVPSLPSGPVVGADGARLVYQEGDQLRWIPGLSTDLTEAAAVAQP